MKMKLALLLAIAAGFAEHGVADRTPSVTHTSVNLLQASDDNPFDAPHFVLTTVLGYVPVVGTLLANLVTVFWPENNEHIFAAMEDYVDQAIEQALYKEKLKNIKDYLNNTKGYMKTYYTAMDLWDPNDGPSNVAPDALSDAINECDKIRDSLNDDNRRMFLPLILATAVAHLSALVEQYWFGIHLYVPVDFVSWREELEDELVYYENELNLAMTQWKNWRTPQVKSCWRTQHAEAGGFSIWSHWGSVWDEFDESRTEHNSCEGKDTKGEVIWRRFRESYSSSGGQTYESQSNQEKQNYRNNLVNTMEDLISDRHNLQNFHPSNFGACGYSFDGSGPLECCAGIPVTSDTECCGNIVIPASQGCCAGIPIEDDNHCCGDVLIPASQGCCAGNAVRNGDKCCFDAYTVPSYQICCNQTPPPHPSCDCDAGGWFC